MRRRLRTDLLVFGLPEGERSCVLCFLSIVSILIVVAVMCRCRRYHTHLRYDLAQVTMTVDVKSHQNDRMEGAIEMRCLVTSFEMDPWLYSVSKFTWWGRRHWINSHAPGEDHVDVARLGLEWCRESVLREIRGRKYARSRQNAMNERVESMKKRIVCGASLGRAWVNLSFGEQFLGKRTRQKQSLPAATTTHAKKMCICHHHHRLPDPKDTCMCHQHTADLSCYSTCSLDLKPLCSRRSIPRYQCCSSRLDNRQPIRRPSYQRAGLIPLPLATTLFAESA